VEWISDLNRVFLSWGALCRGACVLCRQPLETREFLFKVLTRPRSPIPLSQGDRLGEIRDRSFENQRYRASGLNLVVAAITLWNTVYLERAADELVRSWTVDRALFKHVSPLGWEHVSLTGDYIWHANKRVAKGGFRPLRTAKTIFTAP
jgi:hypothetical protein